MTGRDAGDTAWVLEPILQVPHVVAAVLLTRDGLVTGYTDALTRPSAERVAAITSTVQGACRTAAAPLLWSWATASTSRIPPDSAPRCRSA